MDYEKHRDKEENKEMALQVYEREFERALASLATPTVDVRLLTSAPQAALLLQGLTILAACVLDASLENEKTRNAIRLLKSPGSFRASLYQTAAGISDSFRTADQAMLRIKINLNDIPDVMTSMVTAYAKPEDRGSTFMMNLQMRNFEEIVKLCTSEAERARQSFEETLKLIQELIQVTTATAGDNDEKVREAQKLLAEFDAQKKALEEQKAVLQKRIEQQRIEIQNAKAKYDKAAKKMTNTWTIMVASLADSIKDIGKLFSGIGSIFSGRGGGGGGGDPGSGGKGGETKPTENGTEGGEGTDKTGDAMESLSKISSKISNSAVGNLQQAAEMAKEMYLFQRQMEQLLYKEDAANRQQLGEIASKIVGTQMDKMNFEEIIYYLSRAVKLLGQVQEHWSILLNFFSSMESVVIGPLARNLKNFDEIVKQEDLRESGILRNELVSSGFRAAALCVSVSRAANIYNEISKKYVMPMIDGSVGKLTMTREEARAQLPNFIESRMPQITDESHKFLDDQLKKAEKDTVAQMMRCRDGFMTALNSTQRRLN